MRKNNFQRLEEAELDRLPHLPLGIAHNVHNKLDNMRTFGNVVDLYLSKIIDVLVMMTGGNIEQNNNNSFSATPGRNAPTKPEGTIPGGPSER